jgi:hypothetical protein
MPYVASAGPKAQFFLIALIVIWTTTSSALRAPQLTLLGKYGAKPSIPFLSALVMLGYGVAGALSSYLGVLLRDTDARLPFIISSVVLVMTALALSKVERELAGRSASPSPKPARAAKRLGKVAVIFIAAMVMLALGDEIHFSVNSMPLFLRYAKPADLEWLMPVFWIGFNIAMFPASVVTKHCGGLIVMGVAGLLGAMAVIGAEMAGNLDTLIVTQLNAEMPAGTWTEIVEANVLAYGEIVVGIDPHLPDVPAVFEQKNGGTDWLPRSMNTSCSSSSVSNNSGQRPLGQT